MIQERSLWKLILLSVVTCGIYSIYFWYQFDRDVNLICELSVGCGSLSFDLQYFPLVLVLQTGKPVAGECQTLRDGDSGKRDDRNSVVFDRRMVFLCGYLRWLPYFD